MLRYEGKTARFDWHYDTEPPSCFRILILFRAEGTVPPFTYMDNSHGKSVRTDVHLAVGDAVILRGTTTYHCVDASDDPSTVRYMLGMQVRRLDDSGAEPKTICNQIRNRNMADVARSIVIPGLLRHLFVSSVIDFVIWHWSVPTARHMEAAVSLGVIVAAYMLSGKMPPGVGTNVQNSIKSIAILYTAALAGTCNPHRALNITAYILGTELLVPSRFVEY